MKINSHSPYRPQQKHRRHPKVSCWELPFPQPWLLHSPSLSKPRAKLSNTFSPSHSTNPNSLFIILHPEDQSLLSDPFALQLQLSSLRMNCKLITLRVLIPHTFLAPCLTRSLSNWLFSSVEALIVALHFASFISLAILALLFI